VRTQLTIDEIIRAAVLIDGWMSDDELRWLAEQTSRRSHVIEVGSWKGRSTTALALATPGRIYAVDHWQGSATERDSWHREAAESGADALFHAFCKNVASLIGDGRLVPIRLPSATAADALREILSPRGADMVFIDGGHTYEEVKADIEAYKALCGQGALLCGHDFHSPNHPVARAVTDCLGPSITLGPGSLWSICLP